MNKTSVINLSALVLVAGLAAGCASNEEISAVRSLAEQAQADAAAAQATASEARAIAEQAMQMSQATDERINRMFQRSMLK